MTIDNWLNFATKKLVSSEILTARLDSLILMEACLNTNRVHLLAHGDKNLTTEQIKWLNRQLNQRCTHKPLAYILKSREFYGRDFFVNSHVLIPRPETEQIINFVKDLPECDYKIADIGTGSGCIGITIVLELPKTQVDLYDIDPTALLVATNNADRYKANVSIYQSDLMKNLMPKNYDVMVANLPYVPSHSKNIIDIQFEPPIALFAGLDGLDLYREFWKQIGIVQNKPLYVITESIPKSQHIKLEALALATGYKLVATDNFIQKFVLL
jgi:release factor glutamine methyltransferase